MSRDDKPSESALGGLSMVKDDESDITLGGANSGEVCIEMSLEKEQCSHKAQNLSLCLTEKQRELLNEQHNVLDEPVHLSSLLRFTSSGDRVVIVANVVSAIAAGVAFPAMSIPFGHSTATIAQSQDGLSEDFAANLSTYALYFVYLGIGTFAAVALSMYGFMFMGERVSNKMRKAYLAAIMRQNIGFFDNIGTGEITTRITSDMNQVQDGISEKISLLVSAISTFVAAFVIGFIYSWKLTLILASTVVLMLVVMAVPTMFIVKYSTLSMVSTGLGGSLAEEALSSIRNAVAFNSQEYLAEKYDRSLDDAEKWGFRSRVAVAMMISGIMCLVLLDFGLSYYISALYLVAGEVDLQTVSTVVMVMFFAAFSLGTVGPYIQGLTSGLAAAHKIINTINRQSPIDSGSDLGHILSTVGGSITLKNVQHVYPSRPDQLVLKSISLEIPAGKVTAFVGASGSGKSTIISLIERFYNPVGGTVLLDGHDTQKLSLKWLRQQMSLVCQNPILFNTTIADNISYGLIESSHSDASRMEKGKLIRDAAKLANAHDFIQSLPEGYDTLVGEGGLLLSGGQKQRIAIARAMIRDPKILLLDEATSALDTRTESLVQDALDIAVRGRTTIMIAHRLSTVKAADNIVVMSDGDIEEQGSHDVLMQRRGAYFRLISDQSLVRTASSTEHHGAIEDSLDTHTSIPRSPSKAESLAEVSLVLTDKSGKSSTQQDSLWTLVKFVLSFNKDESSLMLLGLVFSVVGGFENPTGAIFYAQAITALSVDSSEYDGVQSNINFWCEMYLMLGLVIFCAYSIFGIAFAYCAERLIHRARTHAFRAMLRQDITFFDHPSNNVGALASILSTEATQLAGMSGVTLGTILVASTTIIIIIVVSVAIAWKLALVVITSLPVVLACGYLRFHVLAVLEHKSAKTYADSASYAAEAASSIQTVASLTREDSIVEYYAQAIQGQQRDSRVKAIYSSCLYGAAQAADLFCIALAFWWGGTLRMRGEIDTLQFFIAFSCLIFGGQAAGSVFANAPDMGKCKRASQTIKDLLDHIPTMDTTSDKGRHTKDAIGSIKLRNVHFAYESRPDRPILKGLDISIKAGEYVAFVGPSGSGKSTIVSLLERFYDPTEGSILLDGQDIADFNIRDYRNHLALVGQEPTLYNGSIRENVVLGSRDGSPSEDDVINACKGANIYDFIMSLPDGLSTVVGSKGSLLSGGQKQRIAIARALIRKPKVLLLDEATSALDSSSEHVVQEALDAAAAGRTTIAVAHRLSTIMKADRIYVIDKGEIVEQGTHIELLELQGQYYEMVKLQSLGGVQ